MAEQVEVKRHKYEVRTYSHVTALMTVFANSPAEAVEIAHKDMQQSLKRQIENATPNPLVRDIKGEAGAIDVVGQVS